jgi:hypothetical protein
MSSKINSFWGISSQDAPPGLSDSLSFFVPQLLPTPQELQITLKLLVEIVLKFDCAVLSSLCHEAANVNVLIQCTRAYA